MLADMLAVKNGEITEDMLLGVQAIFSVPERLTDRQQFKTVWEREGLDPSLVPDDVKPVHIFMRACDSVKTGKRGRAAANRVVEISPELVSHDDKTCVYQITRLVRNKEEQVIDHPKAMTLVFNKDSGSIQCIPRDPESYAALHDTEETVRDYYRDNAQMVPGAKIRGAVRDTFLKEGATRVADRSAVYFVPTSGYEKVEAVQRVLAELYGGDSYVHVIPYLNTNATREIVERHHVADVKSACERMVADIHNRLNAEGANKVRKDFVANSLNQRMELNRRIKQYKQLLGSEIDMVAQSMSLLDDQIDKLMDASAAN
jgi:hypothetical protein